MNSVARCLAVLGVGAFFLLCEARPAPTHDYIFGIRGVVTTEDGTPIQGADIALEVDGPVYKGVELIKTAKSATDDKGEFSFMYMSHRRGVKYKITVSKDGFESQTLSGASPPAAQHAVRLRSGGAVASPHDRLQREHADNGEFVGNDDLRVGLRESSNERCAARKRRDCLFQIRPVRTPHLQIVQFRHEHLCLRRRQPD